MTLTLTQFFSVKPYFAPDWFSSQVNCLVCNGQINMCRFSTSIVSQFSFCWVSKYEYILQLFLDRAQLEALREEYSKLERDYVTSRQKSKQKITDYVSDEAGVKFTELQNQLKKLRADISLKHPVSG